MQFRISDVLRAEAVFSSEAVCSRLREISISHDFPNQEMR